MDLYFPLVIIGALILFVGLFVASLAVCLCKVVLEERQKFSEVLKELLKGIESDFDKTKSF